MDLKVPYGGQSNKEKAFQGAREIIPTVVEKFGVKAEVDIDEVALVVRAKGKGFEARIEFKDSCAEVHLNLGLLLKPFKGKILETIEKQIKKIV